MRRRDPELSKGWGQIATPLYAKTKGGRQKVNCANVEGTLRLIQSIPSKKAEPFKLWLDYFDKTGKSITYTEWIEKYTDADYRLIRVTPVSNGESIFTTWEGQSENPEKCHALFTTHSNWGGSPWKSLEEAEEGHDAFVKKIR